MSIRDRTTLLKPSRLGSITIDIQKVPAMKQTCEGKNKSAQWQLFYDDTSVTNNFVT